MTILTLQQAASMGHKPMDYELDIGLSGKALVLDFRTKGRGDWIDCYFSCAKKSGAKFKIPVFANDKGIYSPSGSVVNFALPNADKKIYIVSADVISGRAVWTKAVKVML